jgi:hypothetical protein
MTMAIGTATNAGQLTATRAPAQELPTIFQKSGEPEKKAQDKLLLAQHTGKGQNIDIMA